MKKLLFALMPMLFMVTACDNEKNGSLDANPKALEFAATGAEAQIVTVTVENVEWSVELNDAAQNWLHLEKQDGKVSVTVDDNSEANVRETKFTIKSNTSEVASAEVTVKQAGATFALSADPVNLSFLGNETEPRTIVVTAQNVEWGLEAIGNPQWLHFEKSDGNVIVSVDTNETNSPREGKFLITSDVDAVQDVVVTVTQKEHYDIANFAEGAYRQDRYENGLSNFDFYLYTYPMENGAPTGEGYELFIEIYSEKPASEVLPDIASGTYVVEGTEKKFTVLPAVPIADGQWFDHSMVVYTNEQGQRFAHAGVASGTLTVKKDGDNYIISADFMLTDGTPLKTCYNGPMSVANPYLSSFVEDTEITGLTDGRVNYYGDYYGSGTCYWFIELWGEGLEFNGVDQVLGTGDYVVLDIYSPLEGDGTRIPAGEYELMPNSKDEYTAVAGYVGFVAAGCWYMYLENNFAGNTLAPLISDVIRISHNGDNYIIEIDALDDAGNRITSRYEGGLLLLDYSN